MLEKGGLRDIFLGFRECRAMWSLASLERARGRMMMRNYRLISVSVYI
jgi:hypothetical protein